MNGDDFAMDGNLTPDQAKLIKMLSREDVLAIDEALLSNITSKWQKVAKIVGTTMIEHSCRVKGIPDIYYAQRVRKLVHDRVLESQGELDLMRYSEVRKLNGSET